MRLAAATILGRLVGDPFLPRHVVALLAAACEHGAKIERKPSRTLPEHDLEITGPDWLVRLLEREAGLLRLCFTGVRSGCGSRA